MSSNRKPEIERDDLVASAEFHDVARFTRGGDSRLYRLRVVAGGAEFWRVSESLGEEPESIKETHFKSSGEAAAFLQEMERALRAGGWTEV